MKNAITLFAALLLTTFAFAQTAYNKEMTTAIEKINVAHPEWAAVANNFEKIVSDNPEEWLPLYYHALAKSNASFDADITEKDEYLDAAQASLDKAMKMQPKESELVVVQANIYMMRIMVEPNTRGMVYSSKSFGSLNKAKLLDAENPRIYVLWGLMVYNMPENFGGGALAANSYFTTAKEKFDNFEQDSDLHPTWGETRNNKMLASYE
ncbi:MAG: hypothetical protein AB8G11_24990 [Saprospiraceae bacterium]